MSEKLLDILYTPCRIVVLCSLLCQASTVTISMNRPIPEFFWQKPSSLVCPLIIDIVSDPCAFFSLTVLKYVLPPFPCLCPAFVQQAQGSDSPLPLMDALPVSLPSDYPLRFSVMSQHADDAEDDDVTHDTADERRESRGDSDDHFGLDLTTSQDVDDLLKALASIDSTDEEHSLGSDGQAGRKSPALERFEGSETGLPLTRPVTFANGGDAIPQASRGGLTKPVEKFSRNGIMSVHQVTASQPTDAEKRKTSQPPVVDSYAAVPVTTARKNQLSGQAPSFRRKPPTRESRDRYKQNRREDTPSPDLVIGSNVDSAGQKSQTLSRPSQEITSTAAPARHGQSHDVKTQSLDRRHRHGVPSNQLNTNSRSASVAANLTGPVQPPASNTYVKDVRNASPQSSLVSSSTPSPDPAYRASPNSEPEQRGTLRKQKEVLVAKPSLRLITTNSGQLMYDDSQPPASQEQVTSQNHGDGDVSFLICLFVCRYAFCGIVEFAQVEANPIYWWGESKAVNWICLYLCIRSSAWHRPL